MVQINADFEVWDVDGKELAAFIKKFMHKVMHLAVANYLRATLKLIPKDTGFLRGSFTELRTYFIKNSGPKLDPKLQAVFSFLNRGSGDAALEAFAGANKAAQREEPGRFERERSSFQAELRGRRRKFYYGGGRRVLKTERSGIPYVTPPSEVLKVSGNLISFNLNVDISYFRINDLFRRIRGSPWGASLEGLAALANTIEKGLDFFPDITQLMTKFKIRAIGDKIDVNRVAPPGIRDMVGRRTFNLSRQSV